MEGKEMNWKMLLLTTGIMAATVLSACGPV